MVGLRCTPFHHIEGQMNKTKEIKQIIVETNYGHVEVMSEGPNGYRSFKTSQGENALEYALNREEYKSGEYELIVK